MLLEPDEPPKNLGWSAFEGTKRVGDGDDSLTDGELVWPVAEYTHDEGCSVTGGYVYQGTKLPRLAGRYLYGDFCSGVLWSLKGAPEGAPADVRRERARRAAAHPHRPRRRRRAAVRLRGGSDLPRGQSATAVTGPSTEIRTRSPGCQAGKPSRRLRRRRPLGSSRCSELVVAVEGARHDDRVRARPEADRHGLGADHDVDVAGQLGGGAEAAQLAVDDAVARGAGQHVGVAEELGQPAAAAAARRSPPACRPARSGRRA